jgi:hypothetical protein
LPSYPESALAHLEEGVIIEQGMITPPVGLNLDVARMGLTETTIAAAPWILVVTAVLLPVNSVPDIAGCRESFSALLPDRAFHRSVAV